jgi:O-antigen ligase
LYLYYVGKTRSWTVIVSLGLVSLATQLTYTRAALLVSVTVLLMILVVHFRRSRSARLGILMVVVVLLSSLYVGLPGGTERWEDYNRIRENASERLQTNAAALQISAEHPVGVGSQAGVGLMRDEAANEAIHNAYLQIAVMYGPALAGLLFLLILILALQALHPTSIAWMLEPMLALQVFGLFFWEEHLSNPSFIIMVNWLVVASAYLIAASLRRGAPHVRRPAWQGVRETNNLSHL